MIARLTGVIVDKQTSSLLIDVHGIGYEVSVSLNSFFDTPETGATVTLHTHFVVRDDAQQLFGFSKLSERALFRHLIKVNGVGPKMGLAILSGMPAEEFARCVDTKDIASLVKLPGVGKKTAERLLIEMRDKITNILGPERDTVGISKPGIAILTEEAESALVALGYRPQDASKMISRVADGEHSTSEQLIRAALKSMVSR
ncbi:MAG: Holliday junction branch migration protein RuvA [Porticoccaceae bacterium]|nr:Holliday junction branch migration protein RuvA [Porticoccaceae bacterium]